MKRGCNSRKRILVTGSAGFIGSQLCERQLADPHFELLRHDITALLCVEVDEIYNLTCPASPIHYQHTQLQTTKSRLQGVLNLPIPGLSPGYLPG